MSGIDLLEDSFPHGTVEGYRRGCKNGACPGKTSSVGDSCSQASIRYAGDWEYRKAVDAGLPVPPMLHDKPESTRQTRIGKLVVEPTIVVADSVAPLPVESASEPKKRRGAEHPSVHLHAKGCKVDEKCPSFIAGGESCGQVARAYWRELKDRKRRDAGLPPRERREKPSLVGTILKVTRAVPGVEATVTELPNGGRVVTVRIPAKVVAA